MKPPRSGSSMGRLSNPALSINPSSGNAGISPSVQAQSLVRSATASGTAETGSFSKNIRPALFAVQHTTRDPRENRRTPVSGSCRLHRNGHMLPPLPQSSFLEPLSQDQTDRGKGFSLVQVRTTLISHLRRKSLGSWSRSKVELDSGRWRPSQDCDTFADRGEEDPSVVSRKFMSQK
jgi:hypothetical protein